MGSLLVYCERCKNYFKALREERLLEFEVFGLDFNNCLVLTALCDKCNEYVIVEEKDFRSGVLTMVCSKPKCYGRSSLEAKKWEEDPRLKVSFSFRCNECAGETVFNYPPE